MSATHPTKIMVGKHRGERWTRLPKTYLESLANNAKDPFLAIQAKDELDRRGTVTPKMIEISTHAVDRASQLTEKADWNGKGVFTWLSGMAEEALLAAKGQDRIEYQGFTFVFKYGNIQPILVTVFKKSDDPITDPNL